jgi:branched-chain amino acid transport system substrate-binding protein
MARSIRMSALLVALLLLLSACGGAAETASDTDGGDDSGATSESADEGGGDEASGDPITIGISLPLTGEFSEPGTAAQAGYETWAEDVNSSGGLLGRPVELIIRDDASDVNTANSDYERLITTENVDLVFGPFSSKLVIPTSEVAERYEMLFVEPAGGAEEVFTRGLEYLFFAQPAVSSKQGDNFVDYIMSLPEDERPQTVAYQLLDDPFVSSAVEAMREKFEAEGLETVYNEIHPNAQVDFAPLANAIADADPDMVVGGTIFEDSVGLVRGMQEIGFQPDAAFFTTGPSLPSFGEALGDAANGVFAAVGWSADADIPTNPEFVESYTALHDGEPAEDAANAYTVGQIVAQAVEAVGGVDDQAALRDHIRETTFETVVGDISFDDAGRPQGSYMVLQWQDGQIETVLPEDSPAKTADPIFPKPEW